MKKDTNLAEYKSGFSPANDDEALYHEQMNLLCVHDLLCPSNDLKAHPQFHRASKRVDTYEVA